MGSNNAVKAFYILVMLVVWSINVRHAIAQAKPPAPIRVAARDLAPHCLSCSSLPEFKEWNGMLDIRGDVVLSILINADGKVTDVVIIRGHRLLSAKTVNAVRQWTFKPFSSDRQPVAVQSTINFSFTYGPILKEIAGCPANKWPNC
jgi:TonB family protein